MIRTFLGLSTLLVLSLFAAGCDAKPKLAVVDAEAVYTTSAVSEKAKAYLQSLSSRFEKEISELQKKADAAPEEDKQAAQEALQKKYGEIQQQFNGAQQNAAGTVQEAFTKALESYRAKSGYDMVLLKNAVLASDKGFDVTAMVIKELDAMAESVDFSVPPLLPQSDQAMPLGSQSQPGAEATSEKTAADADASGSAKQSGQSSGNGKKENKP